VLGVHGLRGDCKVAGDPRELRAGLSVTVRRAGRPDRSAVVETVRAGASHLRIRLAGVLDANAAAELRGAELYADASDLPALAPSEFRIHELVGMRVVDESLGELGEVVDVAKYPNCDMLLVGEKRLMVPLLRAYAVVVDRAARRIATTLPPGYEDLA
jgi:16S rRNA processing protein RimM